MTGGSGERFCYQLMPNTYKAYSIKVLGYYETNPSETTVEYVVTNIVNNMLAKGLSVERISLAWNAGEGATKCSSGTNRFGQRYDSCSYIQSVSNHFAMQ